MKKIEYFFWNCKKYEKQNHSEGEDNRNVGALIQSNQWKLFTEIISELRREWNDVLHSTLRKHFVPHCNWTFYTILRIKISLIVIRIKLHMTWQFHCWFRYCTVNGENCNVRWRNDLCAIYKSVYRMHTFFHLRYVLFQMRHHVFILFANVL